MFADKSASAPFTVELYVAYKVYRLLGGTFDIPKLQIMYVHKKIDVINYLAETEIKHINTLVNAKSKIKAKKVVIPTNKKAKK